MLKASSEFLSREWLNILESLNDGVLVVDADGELQFVNEGGAELAGIPAHRSIGKPIDRILSANSWLTDLLKTTRDTGVRNVRAEGVLTDSRAPWRAVPVRAAATLLADSQGQHVGCLLTLQDMSYQRELESRSRESERLQQLEILVAGLAHEVKNPLSGMKGAAQILESVIANTPRTKECTNILLHEIDRLTNLIGQLLDIASPSRLETRTVNIHELLDQVVLTLEPGLGSGIRITRAFDPSLPPVRADVSRLIQVMMNLIRNAVEAMDNGDSPVLTFSSTQSGGQTVLKILDNGSGIPPDIAQKIFEKGVSTKGSDGFGLAHARQVIEDHGGSLELVPDIKDGAGFEVRL